MHRRLIALSIPFSSVGWPPCLGGGLSRWTPDRYEWFHRSAPDLLLILAGLRVNAGGRIDTTRAADKRHLLCFRAMAEVTETLLDASGLTCPMPLLKAKQALNGMQPGMRLRVIATDPGSVRDFEVFSAQSGNALLESRREDGSYFYLLQKKDG